MRNISVINLMVMPKQNKKSEYRLGIFFFGNKLIMTDIFLGLMLICCVLQDWKMRMTEK
jgi:hypothetical protein